MGYPACGYKVDNTWLRTFFLKAFSRIQSVGSRLYSSSTFPQPRFLSSVSAQRTRLFSFTANNMGVQKQIITPGDGVTKAKSGDTITMEYTGYLQDTSAPNSKGKQ